MAEELKENVLPEGEEFADDSLGARFADWVRTELVWYAGSFTVHLLGLSLLLLVANTTVNPDYGDEMAMEAATKADVKQVENTEEFQKFDIGEPEELPPTELDVDPSLEKAGQLEQKEEYNDDSTVFEHRGGGMASGSKDAGTGGAGGFDVIAYGNGPKVGGSGGIGVGLGTGKSWGSGGDGTGYGGRGSGHRKAMLASGGGTKHTERAVTGALIWLARHQNPSDGSWSLKNYTLHCRDKTCTGPGSHEADAGATAMGLLPFLAAGQTHKSQGPYQRTVLGGLNWLIKHQKPDGDLAAGAGQKMYSHGLASIALCEAYGLTGDPNIGRAAQGAINYVLAAQNKTTGGWRYNPGDPGDTSVVGWQIMALKSAIMAGLSTSGGNSPAFEGGSKWLDSCAKGDKGHLYSYEPGGGPSNTMTSVGLLCRQYLGAKRDSPMMAEGRTYFMQPNNLPSMNAQNCYYWYYATQVMHNMPGYEWDTWNRTMRKILVDSQCRNRSSCANGSWDPEKDQWGKAGGRVMMTALCCLTLEIYYRYLPLFKTEGEAGGKAPAKDAPKAKAKGEAEA